MTISSQLHIMESNHYYRTIMQKLKSEVVLYI